MAQLTRTADSEMPPKLDKEAPTGRMNILASELLFERMDTIRVKHRPYLNKSETARILIELALDLISTNSQIADEFERRRVAEKDKLSSKKSSNDGED